MLGPLPLHVEDCQWSSILRLSSLWKLSSANGRSHWNLRPSVLRPCEVTHAHLLRRARSGDTGTNSCAASCKKCKGCSGCRFSNPGRVS